VIADAFWRCVPVPSSRVSSIRRQILRRALADRSWRDKLFSALIAWNRHQVARVVGAVIAVWLLGATGLFFAERWINPDFATWGDSLWGVWVLLFSGLDQAPKTMAGRLIAMLILVVGVGTAGLFTASLASLLVERYLRRRMVTDFETEDHLVLCNWSARGLEWIREVHAKIITDKRPVVIIHDAPDEIELPDKQDDPAFSDVFIVKGDPTNEVILRRAKVPGAHSVVILSDDREGKHADGKSVLTCIAIRSICRGDRQPNVTAECRNAANRRHLKKAGADEIISSDELGLRLLARSALYHGMTRVYQELLTVGRDANEMYLLAAPEGLIGKDFAELSAMFSRKRDDKRACLLVGIQRGDEMHLNPIGGEAGPLKPDDQLILLSRVFLKPTDPLPTDPPVITPGEQS
jgi:voltage-gated potassium channel